MNFNREIKTYFKNIFTSLTGNWQVFTNPKKGMDYLRRDPERPKCIINPISWSPQNLNTDTPVRNVQVTIDLWSYIKDKRNNEELADIEDFLMQYADQLIAKMVEDYDDAFPNPSQLMGWNPDQSSFTFVEIENQLSSYGLRIELTFQIKPNFEIEQSLWL